MGIWRYLVRLSVIAFVFTLLVACSSSGQSTESDAPADKVTQEATPVVEKEDDAADSQGATVQETPAGVDEGDDAAGSESEETSPLDAAATEVPEQATDVPKPAFAPESIPDGMVMVYVPEGEFEMGTSDEQRDRLIEEDVDWEDGWNSNEQPIHTVYLDAFWVDQTEVTNGQYALCVADGACQEPHSLESDKRISYFGNPEFIDFQVVYVDWYMAEAYCAWVGRRLPTESEWEKAARGTDGRPYPWGDGIDHTLANYGGYSRENSDTTAVGSYPDGASPYGALDMAGNVFEWVADEYDKRYYHNSPSENPLGPSFGGARHVIRGGSWNGTTNSVRSAVRRRHQSEYRDFPSVGIRCAASP